MPMADHTLHQRTIDLQTGLPAIPGDAGQRTHQDLALQLNLHRMPGPVEQKDEARSIILADPLNSQ